MKVNDLLNIKQLTLVNSIDFSKRDINNIYIGDLLSWVMGHLEEDSVWLTVQNHINVIAVGHLHDVAAIVFVEGSYPMQDTIDKAIESQIPLFTYNGTSYELAIALHELGL